MAKTSAEPSADDDGEAYGQEGEFYICATCGKSVPISRIEGQCTCGKKVCTECGKKYPLCAKCGWVICRHCHSQSTQDKKHYHNACMPTSSGCFIATAAYGSPLATELDTLREFRDQGLSQTALGSSLIQLYYAMSPPLAEAIAGSSGLRALVRFCLNPIVVVLKLRYD